MWYRDESRALTDVQISIEVDASQLTWPEDDEADDELNLGMNRSYFDMRGLTWKAVEDSLVAEREYSARLSGASDHESETEKIDEERYEDIEDPTWHLDIGVASAVCALSAFGCVPFSSCNGGVWGDGHHAEAYPLVAFHAQANMLDKLQRAAEMSRAGLYNGHGGSIVVYAGTIEALMSFAQELYDRRDQA